MSSIANQELICLDSLPKKFKEESPFETTTFMAGEVWRSAPDFNSAWVQLNWGFSITDKTLYYLASQASISPINGEGFIADDCINEQVIELFPNEELDFGAAPAVTTMSYANTYANSIADNRLPSFRTLHSDGVIA